MTNSSSTASLFYVSRARQSSASLHYNHRAAHYVIQQKVYNKLHKGYKKMWNYADMTDPSLHLLRPYIWNCVIQQIMSRVLGTDGSRNVKWHQARYAQPMSLWALGTSSSNDGYEQLTSRHRAFRAHVAQFILPILLHAIAKCVDGDVHSPRLQMAVGDCCPSIYGQNTGYELVYTSKLRINTRHATGFMPSPGAGWSKGFVIFLNRSGNLLK